MRVIIAAGGTGGHIFPGVAIAREFKERDQSTAILFVGTARGLESKIVPRAGFDLELIKVGALKGVSVFERTKSLGELPPSFYYAHVPALGLIMHGNGIGGARAAAEDLVKLWLAEKK